MEQLRSIVKGTNILIQSDEVYEHLIFDDIPHQSDPSLPRSAGTKLRAPPSPLGKVFHCTGWKLGYSVSSPTPDAGEFRNVHQFNCFSCHAPSQVALSKFLADKASYLSLGAFMQQKRDYFATAHGAFPVHTPAFLWELFSIVPLRPFQRRERQGSGHSYCTSKGIWRRGNPGLGLFTWQWKRTIGSSVFALQKKTRPWRRPCPGLLKYKPSMRSFCDISLPAIFLALICILSISCGNPSGKPSPATASDSSKSASTSAHGDSTYAMADTLPDPGPDFDPAASPFPMQVHSIHLQKGIDPSACASRPAIISLYRL